ncbi:MAG TPA: prepilin-type N-terminal cleavage/methylation domain-containing protein [Gemmatimonadaceae bacterium]|nr:prepilin-type N-terminal cleavage/methylation domain-containing protein [Gemmatimonadaceae bacterium]
MRVNMKKGFTLIELLIVIVIIGILAAIAIPKFAATKDKAKLASVRTDIRNYETAEEAYFSDYSTYGTSADLIAAKAYAMSNGNSVGGTDTADSTSYSIEIKNASISTPPDHCSVTQNTGATTDGQIICQ